MDERASLGMPDDALAPADGERAGTDHPASAARRAWLAALLLQQHDSFTSRLAAALSRWRATPRRARRHLGRRVALSAAGTALILSLVAGPLVPQAHAATITVDGVTCDLIDAIIAANGDTATGGCAAGSGDDILELTADVTLTSAYGSYLGSDTGLPLITSDIAIEGNGHTIARDPYAPDFRLMAVDGSGELSLARVTLSGGVADDASGGAVANMGSLNAYHTTFSDNEASIFGGAVFNRGLAVFTFSTVSGNVAGNSGGGVTNYDGLLYAYRNTISDNGAYGYGGGGVLNYLGLAVISGGAISNNLAALGGGVAGVEGTTYLIENHVSANLAIGGGGVGAIDGDMLSLGNAIVGNYAYYFGGGVGSLEAAHVDIYNTTISGNLGSEAGGGVTNLNAMTHIDHSTLSDNVAYYGGGVYSNYLYVLGGAAQTTHAGGPAMVTLERAGSGRQLTPAQRERLLALAPDGFKLDGAAIERLGRLNANGARPRQDWGAVSLFGGAPAGDLTAARTRLEAAGLSGDVLARAQQAREQGHGNGAPGSQAHHGPGADATTYQTILYHSIVSGNEALGGSELAAESGGIISNDYNVLAHDGVDTATALYNVAPSGSDFVAASDAGNVPLSDIIDPTLAYNGGNTLNHALVSGSPAMDMIDHGVPYDQRGYDRPVNTYYDAGSYEYSPLTEVYVSSDKTGVTDDAVPFGPHDVLGWDSGSWSSWFDGSGANLVPNGKAKHNINAIWMPDPGGAPSAYFSFAQNGRFVPNISGKVDGMDIVWWDGFDFYLAFDGQDVGLTNKSQEKIDALHVLEGWRAPQALQTAAGGCFDYLLISTQGPGAVPGVNGTIRFSGEDILGFCLTQGGANTKGKWTLALDGSAEGMPRNSLANLSASESGKTLYLMTKGVFNVDEATGGHSMIYRYDFGSGEFTGPHWIAADEGLNAYVDALEITEQ